MSPRKKVFFLFLDGVGLGANDPAANPFAAAAMPNLESLLGGHKLVLDAPQSGDESAMVISEKGTFLAMDACMGIEGLPQSATGQAALLTGKNVSAWLGEHEGPKPSPPIVEVLRQGTLFSQLRLQGKTVEFLNAYPPRYFESIERDYHIPGVIALSAKMAGLHLKTENDLFAGRALSADFTGEGWRSHLGYPDTPLLSPSQVGERLVELASQADLAMFEYWLTDVAGHHQDLPAALAILETLDEVLGSLGRAWDDEAGLVLVTSDHGNLEDLRTRHHTRNDVPLLLIGSQAARDEFLDGLPNTCRSKPDLTAITPAIMKYISDTPLRRAN